MEPQAIRSFPTIPSGVRLYAVGDIHGRLDLLEMLQARIDVEIASPSHDVEIYLGDYIDRGPSSAGVIENLIRRGENRHVVCLMGNHELYMLRTLKDPAFLERWLQVGAAQTFASYGLSIPRRTDARSLERAALDLAAALPRHHGAFLGKLGLTHICGDYLFVHAGLRPGLALAEQSLEDLVTIRDDFLKAGDDFGRIVVHGHSPVQEPDFRSNRIDIDTGAYVTGRLTCLVLENGTARLL